VLLIGGGGKKFGFIAVVRMEEQAFPTGKFGRRPPGLLWFDGEGSDGLAPCVRGGYKWGRPVGASRSRLGEG
jgi:hypothetical protein